MTVSNMSRDIEEKIGKFEEKLEEVNRIGREAGMHDDWAQRWHQVWRSRDIADAKGDKGQDAGHTRQVGLRTKSTSHWGCEKTLFREHWEMKGILAKLGSRGFAHHLGCIWWCDLHNYQHPQFAGEETESKDNQALYMECRASTQAQVCCWLALLCSAPGQSELQSLPFLPQPQSVSREVQKIDCVQPVAVTRLLPPWAG